MVRLAVSCDVTGNTYNSALTVHVLSAGVFRSRFPQTGELLLGTRDGVHLDSADSVIRDPASSHHDPVLELYGTSTAENEDGNNINDYSD